MKKITTYLFSIMLLFSFAIIPVYALDGQNVNFDLHSIVYDDGEAIDSVVLKTSNLEIDDSKITKDMFNVHATGTTVYSSQLEKEFFGPNSQSGLQHCGLYDEERKVLIGEDSNKTYKIGDEVKIRVVRANKQLREIDFEIVQEEDKEETT